jgi:hypothetical protein
MFIAMFTLMMEAVSAYETLVNLYRTVRRYIPEDNIIFIHRCENLKILSFRLDLIV